MDLSKLLNTRDEPSMDNFAASRPSPPPIHSMVLPLMPALNVPTIPSTNISSQKHICCWQQPNDKKPCHLQFADDQLLFNHVNTQHIGRKKTDNLCLKCHWKGCNVSCSKRDHITSHLKTHIPIKPFQCLHCPKSFKRAQDLNKHRKNHDDTSATSSTGAPQHRSLERLQRRDSRSTITSENDEFNSSFSGNDDFSTSIEPTRLSGESMISIRRSDNATPPEVVKLAPISTSRVNEEDLEAAYLSDPGPETSLHSSRKRKFLEGKYGERRRFKHSIHFLKQ